MNNVIKALLQLDNRESTFVALVKIDTSEFIKAGLDFAGKTFFKVVPDYRLNAPVNYASKHALNFSETLITGLPL
jgi:hypothetical protein